MAQYISPNQESLFGATDDQTIQNAVALAVEDGCRKLLIPRYNLRRKCAQWRISRCIRIPSDFTVILDNCYMVMETGVYDHMFTNWDSYTDQPRTLENEQHDITILGQGNVCLDGGVHNHLLEKTSGRYGMPPVWRNTMLYWVNVRNLRVENLHIENQRWWAITHIFCRHVKLKNLDFGAIPHVPNMDGIDLRVGCNHFEIENITGRTGDDVIAMTALSGSHEVRCRVAGKDTDIHDVSVRNVLGDPFLHLIVRLLNHDGNQIYNIDLDTIFDTSDHTTKKRPRAAIGIGASLYSSVRSAQTGDTRNITARNITSRSENGVRIDCTLSDSTFTNVKTFGDNLVGIGTLGQGCELSGVVFHDLYYGAAQQEIFCSTTLTPDQYHGTVIDLPNTTGDLTVHGLHVDRVNTVIRTEKGLRLTVTEQDCVCCLNEEVNYG